jgi:hypothetical protein
MQHWGVPDDQAMQLIDQAPSASGKRPEFALTTDQAERLEMLREIDRHAGDVYQEAGGWLRRSNPSLVFAGLSPLAYMIRDGRDGIETVLRRVHMIASGRSLADKRRGR